MPFLLLLYISTVDVVGQLHATGGLLKSAHITQYGVPVHTGGRYATHFQKIACLLPDSAILAIFSAFVVVNTPGARPEDPCKIVKVSEKENVSKQSIGS